MNKEILAYSYLVTPESNDLNFLEQLVDFYGLRKIRYVQWRNNKISDAQFVEIGLRLAIICKKYRVEFIINNRFWLLTHFSEVGLHLGQSDLKDFNPEKYSSKILGISASNYLEAKQALIYKPTYLGIGAIRPTTTKSNAQLFQNSDLNQIRKLGLPLVAIGGLGIADIDPFLERGFNYVAMCQALVNNCKKELFLN